MGRKDQERKIIVERRSADVRGMYKRENNGREGEVGRREKGPHRTEREGGGLGQLPLSIHRRINAESSLKGQRDADYRTNE